MNERKILRKKMRKAAASGNNNRVSRLSKKFDNAGGNSIAANKRITAGLQAKDARGQLRSAINTGDTQAVRGATRAVRATSTNANHRGSALRIKTQMGY
jgi:hypothetical protein